MNRPDSSPGSQSGSQPDSQSGSRPGRTGRTGRPPATSRAQILAAAREIIDRSGWEKLTIRRLAGELGIGATTLYHHVRDREDLLVQLLNEHSEQMHRTDLPTDPRERIVEAAIAIHDTLRQRPWATEILTIDGFIYRLSTPALQMVEAMVDGAIDCGCTQAQAVDLFRNVWYYTVGEILIRTHSDSGSSSSGPSGSEAQPIPDVTRFTGFDSTQLPRLAAIGDQWPAMAAQDTYSRTVRVLVDGLLARAASEAP